MASSSQQLLVCRSSVRRLFIWTRLKKEDPTSTTSYRPPTVVVDSRLLLVDAFKVALRPLTEMLSSEAQKQQRASNHDLSSTSVGHFAKRVERACIISGLLSMLALVNAHLAMPSYNLILAGWGLLASYSRSSRAAFGLLCFGGLSIIIDIIFLSMWSYGKVLTQNDRATVASTTTAFSVAMMSGNMVSKLAILYYTSHLFAVVTTTKRRP